MNSSPLNPDAPVFIPGSVAGSDVLLAESPRKPLPMDDIELPDVAQFETEAVVRPKELQDLDNCDQLNGHHNASLDLKEHLNGNGNEKGLDSLGFGFNVGIEPDKVKDSSLIQDFERIQKDTTDFCNIQVFQANTETNPFAEPFEGNDELFERLKNKERDPMSMSFYQEKDDDTCERLVQNDMHVDLNAVQPLPDSDDEDLQPNGISENDDKENISPAPHTDPFASQDSHEPNNDIMRFDDRADNLLNNITQFGQTDNCNEYSVTNNVQPFSNIDFEANNIPQETVLQTDTPESHKLMFEQIPEIPDGKSSELGFTNDDLLDPESERDDRAITPQEETSQLSQETEDSRRGDTPAEQPEEVNLLDQDQEITALDNGIDNFEHENQVDVNTLEAKSLEQLPISPVPQSNDEPLTPEPTHEPEQADILIHENAEPQSDDNKETTEQKTEEGVPQIQLQNERLSPTVEQAAQSLFLSSPVPQSSLPSSPLPQEAPPSASPAPSPLPREPSLPRESPLPTDPVASPVPTDASLLRDSPLPVQSPLPEDHERELLCESPLPSKSPLPQEIALPSESPLPAESPVPVESQESRTEILAESSLSIEKSQFDVVTAPVVESLLEPEICNTETFAPSASPALSPPPAEVAPASPAPADIAASPIPEPTPAEVVTEAPLVAAEQEPLAAPAPDLLSQAELVTDLDVGLPESRAQEICVPLADEIRPEDGERPADTTTPPPTPAVDALTAAPLAAAAAVAAGAAVAAATATAKKTPAVKKTSTPLAKSEARTPRSAPKAAPAPRTPASATKRPATAPAAKTSTPLSARTSLSASKSAAPKPAPAVKVPPPIRAPSKTAVPAAKPAPAPAASKPAPKPAVPRAAPAPKPAAPKPAAPRAAAPAAPRPVAARPAAPKPAVPRVAAAPKPAAPRAASAPAARPAPRPAPAPARKVLERKPLANGDAKDAAKPAAAARPASARPAPRPAPRAAAPIPPTAAKTAAPKPAARATPLDKQSKDLANKRITAKAAPPRTATTKAPSTKTAVSKVAPKKSIDAPKKEGAVNGLSNGTAELAKPPPSPPAQDNAALPDVIA